jgi:hypothetical protein
MRSTKYDGTHPSIKEIPGRKCDSFYAADETQIRTRGCQFSPDYTSRTYPTGVSGDTPCNAHTIAEPVCDERLCRRTCSGFSRRIVSAFYPCPRQFPLGSIRSGMRFSHTLCRHRAIFPTFLNREISHNPNPICRQNSLNPPYLTLSAPPFPRITTCLLNEG